MPPAAAIRAMQPNGQTARNGQDRSLQTYRKFAIFPLRFSTVWGGAFGTAYLILTLNSPLFTLRAPRASRSLGHQLESRLGQLFLDLLDLRGVAGFQPQL